MGGSRLRFDAFEIDLDSKELLREGASIKLAPQPFQVLATLALRSGAVVSRNELKTSVWGEEVHVDYQGSLHSCIKQVRAALGDDPSKPRFIETLPRRGYRFLPSVTEVDGGRVRRSVWPVVAGLGALVLVGGTLATRFREPLRAEASGGGGSVPDQAVPAVRLLVSPFPNETGNKDLDYLGQTLADETRARLQAIDPEKLVVLAPLTSERYDTASSAPAVDYSLEGRIVDTSGRAGVELSLIRRSDGARVWEDRIQQEDPVGPMVAALVPRLLDGNVDDPVSPEEGLYLKGRYLLKSTEGDALDRATTYFEESIARSPEYAPAHVGLAEARLRRAMQNGSEEDYASAESAARQALALSSSSEAQFVLALSRWFGAWDWDEAGQAFQRALLESPGLARAHHWYAYYLTGLGRHREAIFEIERARKLDPLSPQVQSDVGWFYYFAGRYDEAIAASRETLELEPSFALAFDCLIESQLAKGGEAAALETARRFVATVWPEQHASLGSLEDFWHLRLDRAVEGFEGRPDAYEAAVASMRLERPDDAVAWLRKASLGRSLWMPMLAVDPRFKPVREASELDPLLRSIGLR